MALKRYLELLNKTQDPHVHHQKCLKGVKIQPLAEVVTTTTPIILLGHLLDLLMGLETEISLQTEKIAIKCDQWQA